MTRILPNRPKKIYVIMTVRRVLLGIEAECLILEGLLAIHLISKQEKLSREITLKDPIKE